jgi:hypothetical protein
MNALSSSCPRIAATHRSIVATLALVAALIAHADPALARKTTPADGTYVGYTGVIWTADYGVTRGRCDQAAIGAALADPRTATPGQSPVATLAGIDLADTDRACAAQALELARHGRTVRWKSANRSAAISIGHDTVARGMPCRPFVLNVAGKTTRGLACQAQRGIWEVTKP